MAKKARLKAPTRIDCLVVPAAGLLQLQQLAHQPRFTALDPHAQARAVVDAQRPAQRHRQATHLRQHHAQRAAVADHDRRRRVVVIQQAIQRACDAPFEVAPAFAMRRRKRVRISVERGQRLFRQVEQRLAIPVAEIQLFPLLVGLHVQRARCGQRHRRMQRAQARRTDHPFPRLPGIGIDQLLRQAGQLRRIAAAIEELIAAITCMADQVEDHARAQSGRRGNSGKQTDIGNGTTIIRAAF